MAADRLCYIKVKTGYCFNILPTFIPFLDCLICYFISTNIIPRKTGNSEVRNLDIYIIDKLLNGLADVSGIPVASIMIVHMRSVTYLASNKNAKQHAPFAITISRILAASGADVNDEVSLASTPKQVLTANAMMGMYFIFRQGTWYRNPDGRSLHHNARDPPIPLPKADEWALEAQVQEEEALDRADDPCDTGPSSTRASRGTRHAFSTIFDCLDNLSDLLGRLDHHAMTKSYSADVHVPPFDWSTLDDLDELALTSDEE